MRKLLHLPGARPSPPNMAARRRHTAGLDGSPPAPYPAPEVTSRPFDVGTLSARSSIRQLHGLATTAGWSVRTYHSRGNHMHDNGRPGPVVDCVGMALSHDRARFAVARWERRDGKAYALEMARTDGGRVNWRDLKAYVRGGS